MKLNFKAIFSILGLLLMLNGGFMLMCLPVSIYYNDGDWHALLISGIFTLLIGLITYVLTKNQSNGGLKKRDGYLVVTMGWLCMSLFGTLPYLISQEIPFFTDAFFETLSGFTTTGASILNDIESIGKGILMWRSLTQWIGGMGIIVLTVAILPLLGIGGMQLFVAEAPGVTPDKLKPRITDTAKRLWLIYLGLTVFEAILLKIGGMNYFDSINHALTTMATGGFSTRNASVAYFTTPFIQYVIIVFMFLAGTNFTLTYFGLHGQLKKIWGNEEFRYYFSFSAGFVILITAVVFFVTDNSFESSFRDSLFQLVSIVTTTGYVTADYTNWAPLLTVIFFMLMFVGASAGSTAGGVKVVRHVILLKNSIMELRRQIHPAAVLPVRLNKKAVSSDITFNIMAFMIIYFMVFAFGSILISALGYDFNTSVGAVATCLGNIGPGFGKVGPMDNFAFISIPGKWILSFLMLLGRLELFTVLILFTPYYWTKH
ncbi:MAG: TrkH family potassium uptake protein [Cyclobacteriaceae bacterium]|nr:TrkH family potassium uptake protein [Cyclobacteriaceae bacterium]